MTTKTKPVTFISFLHDQRLIVEPKRNRVHTDQAGNVIGGEVTPGRDIRFKDRKFRTDDPELIEYLRNHPRFNTPRGWREDYDAARPSQREQFERIAELAAAADIEGLLELIAAEEASGDGGRDAVLTPARRALERLEEQAALIENLNDTEPESEDDGEGEPAEAGSTDENGEADSGGPPDGEG